MGMGEDEAVLSRTSAFTVTAILHHPPSRGRERLLGPPPSPMGKGSLPVPARASKGPVDAEVVKRFEKLIDEAETPQQRAYAGFFVLLALASSRCMDAQRTRGLRLTADALCGESVMKGKKEWTQWFCPRRGLDIFIGLGNRVQ